MLNSGPRLSYAALDPRSGRRFHSCCRAAPSTVACACLWRAATARSRGAWLSVFGDRIDGAVSDQVRSVAVAQRDNARR